MVEVRDEHFPGPLPERKSECPLLQLPQELLCLIFDYLPPAWIISLSLTCKSLRSLVHSLNIVPERGDINSRSQLLSVLQKDVPDTYFCFCCWKLRRLDPFEDWNGQPHRWTPGPYTIRAWWMSEQNNIWHVPAPYHYPTFKSHFHVEFMEAYLVMNAHFLGPSHGLPLKSLERYVSFQDQIELNLCQASGNHSLHPGDHPRNGQGLVSLCHNKTDELPRLAGLWSFSHETLHGPLVPWPCLARLISSLEPEVCRHVYCSAGSTPPFCNLIPPQRHGNEFPRSLMCNGLYMVPPCVSSESDSCVVCNTDFDISLKQDKDSNEWIFSLSAYHCLGSCRTPFDELWNWFINDMPRAPDAAITMRERNRRMTKLAKLIGTARQNWIQGGQSQLVYRGGKEQKKTRGFTPRFV
ncbi:hypothetical protein BBK36DRAFT_1117437 [Trichoderma citrinoviride]|uniref:F-box domain-containing protein n=1 Tax=Trichoderma citrinoviride TaxID=58853 RepID=A0A2T4BBZ0_9HYPO|nr:hypothetical protein BBK36DRAFT_1117437 [Trichoderma citrinoviride]PTB66751.1 hypothetical protein BBK36DRAFT_1117437 [Trichoderma citrinoviride]